MQSENKRKKIEEHKLKRKNTYTGMTKELEELIELEEDKTDKKIKKVK